MTTGKTITGAFLDSLNFPNTIIPATSQISDVQKALLKSGALNIVSHTDPWGRTCSAYAGFKNPHEDQLRDIAGKLSEQQAQLPHNWDNADWNLRAVVPGSVLGDGQTARKLTDTEIKDINYVNGALKDITYLSNRQSGMCIDELAAGVSPWSIMGNTGVYGSDVAIPTSPSSPGGIVVPGLANYLSIARSVNSLSTVLANVPNVSSGPCAFIEDIMGALMKAGSILGEIWNKIKGIVGVLAMALAVVGLAKLLIDIIKNDLKYLGQFMELLKMAALAGLLEGLMSDPCMAYLINSAIATTQTISNLKSIPV